MKTNCPFCGTDKLEKKTGGFRFEPPSNLPGGVLVIPDATWWECNSCGEQIIPEELDKALDRVRYQRLGLLSPEEIREVRKRTGLSAVDMAQALGVGEKTYTRWENGKSIQNKSNDTLIRILDKNAAVLAQLEAERSPDRDQQIRNYLDQLEYREMNEGAIAAHGGLLSTTAYQELRNRLKQLAEGKKN